MMTKMPIILAAVLLIGCSNETELTSLRVRVQADIIEEIPSVTVGVKPGQTEEEVEETLVKLEYSDDPSITTITSETMTKLDCGIGNPVLLKTYSKLGKHNGQDVEFQLQVYFKDNAVNDNQCVYHSVVITPIKVREPSYMKEMIDAKNQ